MKVVLRQDGQGGHEPVQERDFDALAAARALAAHQGRQDARCQVETRGLVRHVEAGARGSPARLSRQAHDPAHGLDDGVKAGSVAPRPFVVEGDEIGHDEARVHPPESRVVNLQPASGLGGEGRHENVGLLCEVVEHPEPLRTLEVQDEAQFVAVDGEVVGRVALKEVRGNGPGVLPLRRLDFDDLGAQVRELHGGEGPAQDPGEVQHSDARQGAGIRRSGGRGSQRGRGSARGQAARPSSTTDVMM